MQITFTLRCVQCMATSVLQDQQYTFDERSLLAAEESLLIRNDLAGMLLRQPMPRLPQLMLWYKSGNIIKDFLCMFKMKLPTGINGMAPFCNLFIKLPSV